MRLLLTLSLLLALAAPASAATLNRVGGTITYGGEGTEINRVNFELEGDEYVFTETGPGVTISPTGDCTQGATPNVAKCPREVTNRIELNLGAGADEVTVGAVDLIVIVENGGAGPDVLRGSDPAPG